MGCEVDELWWSGIEWVSWALCDCFRCPCPYLVHKVLHVVDAERLPNHHGDDRWGHGMSVLEESSPWTYTTQQSKYKLYKHVDNNNDAPRVDDAVQVRLHQVRHDVDVLEAFKGGRGLHV